MSADGEKAQRHSKSTEANLAKLTEDQRQFAIFAGAVMDTKGELFSHATLPEDVAIAFWRKAHEVQTARSASAYTDNEARCAEAKAKLQSEMKRRDGEALPHYAANLLSKGFVMHHDAQNKMDLIFTLVPAVNLREVVKAHLKVMEFDAPGALYRSMDRIRVEKLNILADVVDISFGKEENDEILSRGNNLRGTLTRDDIVRILSTPA